MARWDTLDQQQWAEMARKADYRAGMLSRRLGVSRRHLERIAKTRFGRSPQIWLDEQQMVSAIALLKERRSVKSIASDLGFKWTSHFSIKFKRHFQQTPTAYLASLDIPPGKTVLTERISSK